jgi:hypothetical protein
MTEEEIKLKATEISNEILKNMNELMDNHPTGDLINILTITIDKYKNNSDPINTKCIELLQHHLVLCKIDEIQKRLERFKVAYYKSVDNPTTNSAVRNVLLESFEKDFKLRCKLQESINLPSSDAILLQEMMDSI